jgi:flagellar hook-length control protein FliK
MQTTTTNQAHFAQQNLLTTTRFVRGGSADGALGFAQVIQAFDSSSDSPLTAPETSAIEEADQRDLELDDTTTREVEGHGSELIDQDAQGGGATSVVGEADQTKSNQQTESGGVDNSAAGQLPIDSTPNATSNTQPASPTGLASQEGTEANDSAIRLLENQSEQAKLSIKGLVRAKTRAASADLTARSVDIRLGRNLNAQNEPTPKRAAGEQINPDQTPSNPTKDSTPPAISAQHRQSPGVIEGDGAALPKADHTQRQQQRSIQVDAKPVDAKPGQSGVDAAQARSQRSEAANGAALNAQAVESTRSNTSSKTDRLAGIKPTQSTQVIRAVAGTNAGNVGNQDNSANAGSLVEKMKGADLPAESRRSGVLAQVQRGLASLLRSGNGEMSLKLAPSNLGEVRIRVKSNGNQLRISFEATTSEATELLRSSAKELGENLRIKGIGIEHIRVEQSTTNTAGDATDASPTGDSPANQPNNQHNNQPNQDQSRQDHHNTAMTETGDDRIDETPGSIWTELGLDATA